jgi:formate/nitrite transporter FocA (FNT family)
VDATAREHEHQSAAADDLNRSAVSATTHCLTGCAIGEITGMFIATALGWSDFGQIALAVGLAYIFGFSLTALPLARAGLATGAIVSTALAVDTLSITIMEVIDNVTVVLWPGAMEAGVGDPIIYIAVAVGFVIAYPFAFLANRYLIARGRGHALVHEYH